LRLQKSVSRRINGKEYVKHQLVIPNDFTSQLGWSGGDYIQGEITRRGFLLCKVEPREQSKRLSYQEFKCTVTEFLSTRPEGTTWQEIRAETGLPQLTPSPIWVNRMKEENGLERHTDPETFKTIWKLPKEYCGSASKTTLNGWVATTGED
jgi:hypothetical protein